MNLSPLWLSLQVAGAATIGLTPIGLLLAWRLSRARPSARRALLEALLSLPLVLPPTVIGYVLLLLCGRGTGVGRWLNDTAGVRLVFTWQGAALAAATMAFPLLVRAAAAAFAAIDPEFLEVGRTLGASEIALFGRVILPLARRGVAAGIGLAFARALGEFGATLLVAGNIAGVTQTLPLALYERVQAGDDLAALRYAALLFVLALVGMAALSASERRE